MAFDPVRRAWVVLWGSFLLTCALAYLVPTTLFNWLQTSRTSHGLTLNGTGPVLVQRPGLDRFEVLSTPPIGSLIVTESNAQATLAILSPGGRATLASVQIYAGSRLIVNAADSPRFVWNWLSPTAPRITLTLEKGRVRVFNLGGGEAQPARIEVAAGPQRTHLETPGSNASVEVAEAQTTISVREGQAVISLPGAEPLTLGAEQRAEVRADGRLIGPLNTERNLITDGSFLRPLNDRWQVEVAQPIIPDDDLGRVEVRVVEGRLAVSLERRGRSWGQVALSQALDVDVRDFTSLRLQFDAYLTSQNLSNCGAAGTECPVMVRIRFVDTSGTERGWLQGYFDRAKYNSDPLYGFTTCPSCSEIHDPHKLLDARRWTTLESDNLLALFAARGYPAAFLKSITIYAAGHQFESNVAQVQLLATD